MVRTCLRGGSTTSDGSAFAHHGDRIPTIRKWIRDANDKPLVLDLNRLELRQCTQPAPRGARPPISQPKLRIPRPRSHGALLLPAAIIVKPALSLRELAF
jgi:hypothetical protein